MKTRNTLLLLASILFIACTGTKNSSSKTSEMKKEIIPVTRTANFEKPSNNPDFSIYSMSISENIATLIVTYSGGCQKHSFSAHFNGNYMKSLPPRATVFLNHNSNNDNCRAIVKDTLYIDLTEVKYDKSKPGTVVVGFNGSEKTIDYVYK